MTYKLEVIDYNDSEVAAPAVDANATPGPRGRPRSSKYIPFLEAKGLIQQEMIPSRGKYEAWWDANKPKAIPRFPYRVYKEWTSWNDFLGTDNKFNQKAGTKWRSIADCTRYIHSLHLKNKNDWLDWCRQPGNLPNDIPARPDLVYDNWVSWNHWLGNKVVAAVQAQQTAAKSQVYYIIRDLTAPGNVLTFGVDASLRETKERWESGEYEIVKLFWYDQSKSGVIKTIVETLSSSYLGERNVRIVPNVWEIVYHLQMNLEQVTTADAKAV